MTPSTEQKSGLASGEVHSRLREQILSGELAPGAAVPSERILSEQFAVNRHAIREALKRLQQAGLVRISQGGATRVLDWRQNAGLDILLDLIGQQAAPPAELVRSVIEMRASIGVDVARRCAERATSESKVQIGTAAEAVADLIEAESDELNESYIALWQLIVDGSENLAYRLALNSLNAALTADPELSESLKPRDAGILRKLGATIVEGQPAAASEAARRLLESDIQNA